jgi:hypothetical protein
MEPLVLENTSTTPKVIIDPVNNVFEFSGESRPENTSKFYSPIVAWFDEYRADLYYQKNSLGKAKKTSVHFKLDYFNSTSAKFILDIFFMLEKIVKEGYEAEVVWEFDKRDTDMKESGEEFSKLAPGVPIRYVEY